MSQALYRKYRPQSLDKIVAQGHITTPLQKALEAGEVSHAYLFSGPRGLGKTSTARIIAQEIGTSEEDLHEIDAASHTGVDNIREINDSVGTLPFNSDYKVYIIDEVHMLSKSAFNALLKTLEEPPSYVIFILATTEPHKVPDTIHSRCEVYEFKQPSRSVLAEHLRNVAKEEGYKIEEAAAAHIARQAHGSFRDGLGLLQKVMTSTDTKKIDESLVNDILTSSATSTALALLECFSKEEGREEALKLIRSADLNQAQTQILFEDLLEYVRLVLLNRYKAVTKEEISADHGQGVAEAVIELTKEQRISSQTLRVLLESYNHLGYDVIATIPLELALMDIFANRL